MQDNLALLYVNPRQWINLPKEGLFYRIYIYPWYTWISIEFYRIPWISMYKQYRVPRRTMLSYGIHVIHDILCITMVYQGYYVVSKDNYVYHWNPWLLPQTPSWAEFSPGITFFLFLQRKVSRVPTTISQHKLHCTSWARLGINVTIQWARRSHILMRCYHVAMVSFLTTLHPISFSKEREKRGSTYNTFEAQKYSIRPSSILYHMICTASRKFHYFSIEIIFIPSTTSFSLWPRNFLR